MATKQGILNDEYFYIFCFEYITKLGTKQADYITNFVNLFYDGIKPPNILDL